MKSNRPPIESEKIKFDRPVGLPLIAKSTRVPQPGPNVLPVNENPIIVLPPADIIKPAAPASPPETPLAVAPSILNWNPPIG